MLQLADDQLTTSADENGHSSSESVSEVWGKGETGNTTDRLDGVEDTEERTGGVVEVILPESDGLKTVHHRPVVPVGHRGDEEEELREGTSERKARG